MRRVLLTALAEFDLIEAQDFYAPNNEWVVAHFLENADKAISGLAETAGIYSMYYGHYRVGIPHFPFSIYYSIENECVVVKAILDDRFGPARISAHFGPPER